MKPIKLFKINIKCRFPGILRTSILEFLNWDRSQYPGTHSLTLLSEQLPVVEKAFIGCLRKQVCLIIATRCSENDAEWFNWLLSPANRRVRYKQLLTCVFRSGVNRTPVQRFVYTASNDVVAPMYDVRLVWKELEVCISYRYSYLNW